MSRTIRHVYSPVEEKDCTAEGGCATQFALQRNTRRLRRGICVYLCPSVVQSSIIRLEAGGAAVYSGWDEFLTKSYAKGVVALPTYEYECRKCGHKFEEFQNLSDEPVKRCPECKGKVERLVSAGGGIIVRGGGNFQPECGRGDACPGCPTSRDTPPCAR